MLEVLRYHGGHSPGDAAQEARLAELKRALAERVLARPAGEVIELSPR